MRPLLFFLLSLVATSAAADTFSTGPCQNTPRCQCKWFVGKRQADCSNAGLTSVPTTLSPDIQALILDGNPIKKLENDVFKSAGLLNVQTLSLVRCQLEYVDENAFKDLKIMTHLDLSFNNLTKINPKTFDGNEGLKTLKLNNNHHMGSLAHYQFPPLSSLKSIDLSHCGLHSVDRTAFKNLGASVESLQLNHNQLQSMREEVFVPLTNLKSVTLHDNPWVCDCRLKNFRDWVVNKRLYSRPTACSEPSRLSSKTWDLVQPAEFACKPALELPVSRVFAAPGVDATLACKVTGSPVPQARWVVNGRIVNNNTHPTPFADQTYYLREERITVDGVERWFNLTITNPSEQDLGSYLCVAENNGGVMEKAVALTFDDPATANSGVLITEEQWHILIGASVCILILLVILAVVCYCCLCRRRKRGKKQQQQQREDDLYDSQKLLPSGGNNIIIVSKQQNGRAEQYAASAGDTSKYEMEMSDMRTPSVISNARQSSTGSSAGSSADTRTVPVSYSNSSGNVTFPDLLDHRRGIYVNGGGSMHTLSPANLMLTPQQQVQYAHLISPFQRSGTLPLHHHHHMYHVSPVPVVTYQIQQQQQQQHQRPGYVTLPRRPRSSWSVPRETPSPNSRIDREPIYDGIGPRTSADGSSRLSLNKPSPVASINSGQHRYALPPYYAPIQELQECPPTPKLHQSSRLLPKSTPNMNMLVELSDLATSSSEVTLVEENISAYCEPFGKAQVPNKNKNRDSVSSNESELSSVGGGGKQSTNEFKHSTPLQQQQQRQSNGCHEPSPNNRGPPKTLPKPKVKPVPPPKPKKSFQQQDSSSPSPDSSQAPLISFQDEGADGSEV